MPLDEVHTLNDDGEVLQRMRGGDTDAFAAVMRRNNQRLYRLARGILRDADDAEEAVQEGYIRAFTHLDGFKGEASLATWLARIVTNEALGSLPAAPDRRHRPRRRPALDRFAERGTRCDSRQPGTRGGAPGDPACHRERGRRASRALPHGLRVARDRAAQHSGYRRRPRHTRRDHQDALSPRKPAVARRVERAFRVDLGRRFPLRRRALRPYCNGGSLAPDGRSRGGRGGRARLAKPPCPGLARQRRRLYHPGTFSPLLGMLLGLTIRDVVLIERLSLAFRPGLCVLTGETGAGKSILMDALALALGRRADASLVRPGAEQAAVAAEFAVGGTHPASAILDKAGIATDLSGTIVLRRIVTADGRSRAFVNDEPASVGLLRELGDNLVEIQGQGEQRGLLDPATHRELLDAFAEHQVSPAVLAAAWHDWRVAQETAAAAGRRLAEARAEEELLRHEKAELDALAPDGDEEDRLAARRALLQNAERIGEAVSEAATELGGEVDAEGGAQRALARALRRLERTRDRAQGLLDNAIAAAERAANETAEALALLNAAGQALDLDPRALEQVEERLFALRALARKHNVAVADLPRLHEAVAARLAAIETGAEGVVALEKDAASARECYIAAAAI